MDPYGAKTRWVDIGSGGPRDTRFTAKPDVDWLVVKPAHGKVVADATEDVRVYISVDWEKVPESLKGKALDTEGQVLFEADDNTNVTVTIPIHVPASPPRGFDGHVQGDGYVAIEAAHHSRNASQGEYAFQEIEWYGRTLSGVEMFPTTAQNFTLAKGPKLEYDFWAHGGLLGSNDTVEVTVQIGPTLNFLVGKELAFGFQLDDHEPAEIHPIPFVDPDPARQSAMGAVPADWLDVVSEEIRNVKIPVNVKGWDKGGKHTITLYGMTTGIIVERILVDFGGIKVRGHSNLGPPESVRL